MKSDQYHLSKILEEASEVIQRAAKAQQFGLDEIQPGQDFSNLERLINEFHDLFTTFENFCEHVGADPVPDEIKKNMRLRKMDRFLQLSKELGQVDESAAI